MKFLNKKSLLALLGMAIVAMVFVNLTNNPSKVIIVDGKDHTHTGKDYVLIVAVGEFAKSTLYPKMDLSQDAAIIKEALLKQTLRDKHEIKELINEKATRANIIQALQEINQKITNNDRFYFYFTGHGTAPSDPALWKHLNAIKGNRNFLNDTAAIIPYDFDEKNLEQTLVIGSRDLQPLFRAIDEKVLEAMIIIDACYSENFVRGEKFPASFTGDKKKLKKTYVVKNSDRGTYANGRSKTTDRTAKNLGSNNKKTKQNMQRNR